MNVNSTHKKARHKLKIPTLFLTLCAAFLGSQSHANKTPAPTTDYIVTLKNKYKTTQALDELAQQAAAHGATLKQSFGAFGVAEVNATEAQSIALAKLESVADIHKERVFVDQLDESLSLAHIDALHAGNITGNNQIIAVLDSGIDTTHPFFAGRVVAEACFSDTSTGHTTLCPNGTAQQIGTGSACTDSLSSCDHGTHVSGIALGANSTLSGAAPSAQLVAIQVSSIREVDSVFYTQASEATLLAAMQWLSQQNYSNLAAINISQAVEEDRATIEETGYCDNDNGLAAAIATFRQNGTATTISSGNRSYRSAVHYPACISYAVTVARTTNTPYDSNASNFGPQVDLLAPGVSIYSSITGGNYGNLTGTSMAAPHVAGIFALLRGAFPSASVDTIESTLKATGSEYYLEGLPETYIEVDAAAAYLSLAGTPAPFFEAESATLNLGSVASNHAGYTGSGFVDLQNVADSSLTITANVADAGNYYVKVRYANGSSGIRYADVVVNNSTAAQLTFPGVGDWAEWRHEEASVYLNAGNNTISLVSIAAPGAANIDNITLVPAAISGGSSNQAPYVASSISDVSVNQGNGGSVNLSNVFADADGDSLSYSLSGTNSAVSASISGSTLSYQGNQAGSATLTVTASDGQASASDSFVVTVNTVSTSSLEAEDHTFSSGTTIDTNNAGFTGTGFVNTPNTTGHWVALTTNFDTAGTYTIGVRYANGSTTNRAASVAVDGSTVISSVDFNGTGSWTTWATTTFDVTVSAGTHTITLNMLTSSGGANIDSYTVDLSSGQPTLEPVASYSFENNLNDSTGNFGGGSVTGATIGTTNSNTQLYTTGVSGSAAFLLGDAGIQLPNNIVTSDVYSVSLWLYPDQLTQFTTAFFGYTSDTNWFSVVPWGVPAVSDNSMIWSGTAWYDAGMGQQIPTGSWSHVVMVNNNGSMTVYLNGQAVFSGTGFPAVMSAGTTSFAIGVNFWDTPFAGRVDELKIFDQAISASDVADLYSL